MPEEITDAYDILNSYKRNMLAAVDNPNEKERVRMADDMYNSMMIFMKSNIPLPQDEIRKMDMAEIWGDLRFLILFIWENAAPQVALQRSQQIAYLKSD